MQITDLTSLTPSLTRCRFGEKAPTDATRWALSARAYPLGSDAPSPGACTSPEFRAQASEPRLCRALHAKLRAALADVSLRLSKPDRPGLEKHTALRTVQDPHPAFGRTPIRAFDRAPTAARDTAGFSPPASCNFDRKSVV